MGGDVRVRDDDSTSMFFSFHTNIPYLLTRSSFIFISLCPLNCFFMSRKYLFASVYVGLFDGGFSFRTATYANPVDHLREEEARGKSAEIPQNLFSFFSLTLPKFFRVNFLDPSPGFSIDPRACHASHFCFGYHSTTNSTVDENLSCTSANSPPLPLRPSYDLISRS